MTTKFICDLCEEEIELPKFAITITKISTSVSAHQGCLPGGKHACQRCSGVIYRVCQMVNRRDEANRRNAVPVEEETPCPFTRIRTAINKLDITWLEVNRSVRIVDLNPSAALELADRLERRLREKQAESQPADLEKEIDDGK